MRRLLASRLGVRPEALVFQTGPHGKPFLTKIDCPFSFNLSHSDDLAVLAISDVDVGVDIERMGSLQEGVADIFFSSDENRMIAAMAPGERALAFYRCWTAKEAVLKALGAGLSLPGKSFTVGFGTDHTLRLLQAGWQKTGIDDWSLAGFDPMPGFAGAVAVRAGGGVRPILKQWDFGSV